MKESYIQLTGIILTAFCFIFAAFLYIAEPRSLAEVPAKAAETVDSAVTKGTVIAGTYAIDRPLFELGLSQFRADNFVAARDSFTKADPEARDPNTQFYIAYSFYRQGWGRFSNDDALFSEGLKRLERVDLLDRDFRTADQTLLLRTPAELRAEFEEGLRVTSDDFNPLKAFRERK